MTVNVTAIKDNAMTISGQFDSWPEAVRGAVEWADDLVKRHPIAPPYIGSRVVYIFMADTAASGLEKHSITSLREALRCQEI